MSQKNRKSTQSLPTMDFNPLMMMFSQWKQQMDQQMDPKPSTSSNSTVTTATASSSKKHPWDDSDSDSSVDMDFIPPSQKKTKLSLAKKPSVQAKKLSVDPMNKRKPGRPKSEATKLKEAQCAADKKIIDNYPVVDGNDVFPSNAANECKCCRLWAGHFAILPCGHCKYCYSCIKKIREEAQKLKRPAQCPADDCFTLVKSWVKLFNISP